MTNIRWNGTLVTREELVQRFSESLSRKSLKTASKQLKRRLSDLISDFDLVHIVYNEYGRIEELSLKNAE